MAAPLKELPAIHKLFNTLNWELPIRLFRDDNLLGNFLCTHLKDTIVYAVR